MNIFMLDTDPDKAAIAHCDKHVVKQEYDSDAQGYKFIPPLSQRSPLDNIFDLKIVPATCVPLPDMSDPKDLAIYELGERCKELERKLKRKV